MRRALGRRDARARAWRAPQGARALLGRLGPGRRAAQGGVCRRLHRTISRSTRGRAGGAPTCRSCAPLLLHHAAPAAQPALRRAVDAVEAALDGAAALGVPPELLPELDSRLSPTDDDDFDGVLLQVAMPDHGVLLRGGRFDALCAAGGAGERAAAGVTIRLDKGGGARGGGGGGGARGRDRGAGVLARRGPDRRADASRGRAVGGGRRRRLHTRRRPVGGGADEPRRRSSARARPHRPAGRRLGRLPPDGREGARRGVGAGRCGAAVPGAAAGGELAASRCVVAAFSSRRRPACDGAPRAAVEMPDDWAAPGNAALGSRDVGCRIAATTRDATATFSASRATTSHRAASMARPCRRPRHRQPQANLRGQPRRVVHRRPGRHGPFCVDQAVLGQACRNRARPAVVVLSPSPRRRRRWSR